MRTYSRIRLRGASAAPAAGRRNRSLKRGAAAKAGAAAEQVVSMMSACIEELRSAGFGETAEILAVARLDLLARIHGVSDEELDQLVEAVAAKRRKPD